MLSAPHYPTIPVSSFSNNFNKAIIKKHLNHQLYICLGLVGSCWSHKQLFNFAYAHTTSKVFGELNIQIVYVYLISFLFIRTDLKFRENKSTI